MSGSHNSNIFLEKNVASGSFRWKLKSLISDWPFCGDMPALTGTYRNGMKRLTDTVRAVKSSIVNPPHCWQCYIMLYIEALYQKCAIPVLFSPFFGRKTERITRISSIWGQKTSSDVRTKETPWTRANYIKFMGYSSISCYIMIILPWFCCILSVWRPSEWN